MVTIVHLQKTPTPQLSSPPYVSFLLPVRSVLLVISIFSGPHTAEMSLPVPDTENSPRKRSILWFCFLSLQGLASPLAVSSSVPPRTDGNVATQQTETLNSSKDFSLHYLALIDSNLCLHGGNNLKSHQKMLLGFLPFFFFFFALHVIIVFLSKLCTLLLMTTIYHRTVTALNIGLFCFLFFFFFNP